MMARQIAARGRLCAGAGWPGVSCSPALAARCTAFLRPALRRAGAFWPDRTITLLARWWWCRGARSVARRVLCAAPDAALRVPCAVPDAVQRARIAAPVAARCQTSSYLRASSSARLASWWFGLQPPSPSKAQMKRPVQIQPRIQGKRARCDDRPVSAPNVHSFSGSRFAALSEHVTNVGGLVIDLDQLGRVVQATLGFLSMGSTLSASEG